ncbi:hypothetical protein LTR85_006070 [Meristemomyces frigidus]|nr:hypothetical protein LTR85_006070 [Meristemomyces frigidus]
MEERLKQAGAQGPQVKQWQRPAGNVGINAPIAQTTSAAYLQFPSAAKDFVAAAAVNNMDFSGIAHLPAEAQQFVSKCVYEAAIKQQDEQQRRVHAHCERSTRMYKKENYLQWINDHRGDLLLSGILGSDKWYTAKMIQLGLGLQLWRDPQAMRAIAQKQKPNCNTCYKDGQFWDGLLRNIPVSTDVLELEGFTDWGVFVAFDCKCCNKEASYSYVNRPSYELGAECAMGGC